MAKATQDEIDNAKAQLAEIKKMSSALGLGDLSLQFTDIKNQIFAINASFTDLNKRIDEAGEDSAYLVTNFAKLVNSIKNASSGINQQNKAMRGLGSIALKINEYQRGYGDLTSSELKKLDTQIDKSKNLLDIAQKTLTADLVDAQYKQRGLSKTSKEWKAQQTIINRVNLSLISGQAILNNWNADTKVLKDQLSKVTTEVNSIEKYLGLSGALTSGLSNTLNKIGAGGLVKILGIDEAKTKMDSLAKKIVKDKTRELEIDEKIKANLVKINTLRASKGQKPLSAAQLKAGNFLGSKAFNASNAALNKEKADIKIPMFPQLAIMIEGIKSMNASLGNMFKDPAVLGAAFGKMMIDNFLKMDEANVNIQRQTGKTLSQIELSTYKMITLADTYAQIAIINEKLGMNADKLFSQNDLIEATVLTKQMGLQADESNRLLMLNKASGVPLKTTEQNILNNLQNTNKTNKSAVTYKGVLQDVTKLSSSISATFGNDAVKMADAVASAKALGLTLEGVNQSADSLLNFESSINNEISAELITGQQLNLEKARLLALNDDLKGLTEEIGHNEGIINGFSKGNRVEREAIAAAIGMSKDQLAEMIFKQSLANGLTDEQAAKATGMLAEDYKKLTVQQDINTAISKMGEALSGPLLALTEYKGILYAALLLFGAIRIAMGINAVLQLAMLIRQRQSNAATLIGNGLVMQNNLITKQGAGPAIATSIAKMMGGSGMGGPAGLVIGAALVGAMLASIGTYMAMKDGEIDASGKPTLFTREGAVKILPTDSVYAAKDGSMKVGTDLFGNIRERRQERQQKRQQERQQPPPPAPTPVYVTVNSPPAKIVDVDLRNAESQRSTTA
jgi:hypothetical protein